MSYRNGAAAVLETTYVCDDGHVHRFGEICTGGAR